jgi:hypothetical protein
VGEHSGQPAPVPTGGPAVADLVRQDLRSWFTGTEYVQDALAVREQVGISRYGTTLQAGNGRDWLLDAFEEALDLAQYLRQGLEEGGNVFSDYMRALHLAMSLAVPMQRREQQR